MKTFYPVIFALIIILEQAVSADDRILRGEVDFRLSSFVNDSVNDGFPSRWMEIDFRPKYEKEFSPGINTFLQGKFRHNFNSKIRRRYVLNEGYFDFYSEKYDVCVGKQVISWGRADSLRPTDQFKIYDYTDLAKQDEEGAPALKINYFFGGYDLEGVFVPFFTKHNFDYSENNRWNPLAFHPFPGNYSVVFNEDTSLEPPSDISSAQFGWRLNRQGRKVDYAFSYSVTYGRVPVSISTNLNSINSVTNEIIYDIRPFYSRQKTIGFDWETFLNEFGFRGELAYNFTKDPGGEKPDVDDPYFQAVTGIDRTFDRVIGNINYYILLQYALDDEYPRHGLDNQAEHGFKHFFRQMVLVNSEFKSDELKKFIIKGMYNLEKRDYIFQPELKVASFFGGDNKVSKEIFIKADIISGRAGTFFGTFRKNDRVEAGVNVYF